ncbi:hypothetical protein M406DRAFT_277672 [Cryphonectria parasitica EP155]|uniref:Uncharacterized protein n=1 Tax=Cryphonectria parasitica (strain ATCC 38755 / EP155) TaxID=660469 RepID=A0A9P4XZF5_CRYP1|nr:uncharacterized protein M406DRAFT_277672 [Cryphonectria parasitica EP155]KAF3764182.1 hypothetical protein M406DRAFT_277672 [Cryphonectria parasitica EP155]
MASEHVDPPGPSESRKPSSPPLLGIDGSTLGSAVADILPIPSTGTQPVSDPTQEEVSHTLAEDPSLSHALATEDHEVKGLAQQDHEAEVLDLGWNQKKQEIPTPLVGGLDNEELWMLIRRFDKQMYHVKATPELVPGGLDLNIADEEEFSPDKLRANIERLYMTVAVGLLSFVKHIARLRSWRETRRTSAFAATYFLAWALDLLVPVLSLTAITLVVYPPSREIMFPPAPVALVDSKTGGVQKPRAGVLGSHDSATGAPEHHKGEAVEQEANNFVNGIASIALSSATGKHPENPTAVAIGAADAKDVAKGGKHAKHDKTKQPMETAMWTKMRPIMHALADVADTWERFGNALSPTPPFPRTVYRLRLALLLVPVFCMSLVTTSYMVTKGTTFGIGFGFFGDPVISRGLALLNRQFPHWQKLLELRNTVLKGVPTNAQLTLTLLRIGEANKAPLPPPPTIAAPPPDQPAEITDEHLRATGAEPPLNATHEELEEAVQHDPHTAHESGGADIDASKESKHGKATTKIIGFFKGTTKGAVKTAMGTDAARAKTTGSSKARDRLGVVAPPGETPISGPVDFKGRFKGKKGHVYITTKSTIPAVAFSTDSTIEKIGSQEREDLHPSWSVAVADIVELKKFGGYGWKAKLIVGWALEREVADGLEIVTRSGDSFRVTALPLRDELFNRLVAMGGQKWVAW